jgi:hypothetical protein
MAALSSETDRQGRQFDTLAPRLKFLFAAASRLFGSRSLAR